LFERIERARAEQVRASLSVPSAVADGYRGSSTRPHGEAGLWSELSFRLRRPLGILSGAIDKLLITPAAGGKGFDVEIIDFKTNRLRPRNSDGLTSTSSLGPRAPSPASSVAFAQVRVESDQLRQSGIPEGGRGRHPSGAAPPGTPGRPRSQQGVEQIPFDFSAPAAKPEGAVPNEGSLEQQVRIAASDYQLQMQAYALAVSELIPSPGAGSSVIATLHFLGPNVEFHLAADLLSPDACRRAIDAAMMAIVSSGEPGQFPVRTAGHCRMCNFLGICPAGREFVRTMKRDGRGTADLVKAVEAERKTV
jgi:hypothetical protein